MAKRVSATIDLSYLTTDALLAADAERQARREAAGWTSRRSTTDDNETYLVEDEAEANELPLVAQNSDHVAKPFTHGEAKALSRIGGRRLRAMPMTARAVMTAKGGKVPGAGDGDIAIYTTDAKGVQCIAPFVISATAWAAIWRTESGFNATHLVQNIAWAPTPQDGDEGAPRVSASLREGQIRGFGYTAVADIHVDDVTGMPHNLGAHRFFFSSGEYFSLVAIFNPGHIAAKEMSQAFPGLDLPPTVGDRMFLAGRVQSRMMHGRPMTEKSIDLLTGNAFINLPSIAWEVIQSSILDVNVPGPIAAANCRKARETVSKLRDQMTQTQLPAAHDEVAPAIQQAVFNNPEDAL